MKIINESEVDITNYPIDHKAYTIKAGETVKIDDKAGEYLLKTYGFLKEYKGEEKVDDIEQKKTEPIEPSFKNPPKEIIIDK